MYPLSDTRVINVVILVLVKVQYGTRTPVTASYEMPIYKLV